MVTVKTECGSCGGTGLYRGFAEDSQEAVVCLDCNGTGCKKISYKPYEGRKTRSDVLTVRRSRGRMLITGVGGAGESMTYTEFLNKFPQA